MKKTKPDAIIHLAEQPSSSFSMIDREHANYTMHNNIEGTLNVLYAIKEICPLAHLIKLGALGVYGTPNIDIAEGFFEVNYRNRKDLMPFPTQPGNFYQLSKAHDSENIFFCCKIWGLCSTDIMQGVVYGTQTPEMTSNILKTRFDFDEHFGTVVNRFCAEAVSGHKLTPYGKGTHRFGFIDIIDCNQCITLAIENPPNQGEYRVFNQFDEVYSIVELSEHVVNVGNNYGLQTEIDLVPNHRLEKSDYYYNVDKTNLIKLGFTPTKTIDETLDGMFSDLLQHKNRIKERHEVIMPKTTWK